MKKSQTLIIKFLTVLLVLMGSLQMAGYIFHSRGLTGLGFSYGMAPLPTVFSKVDGVEGFDTRHKLIVIDKSGKTGSIPIDKNLFARFHGAYSLKNAYSLFLAYPHVWNPDEVNAGHKFLQCKKNILFRFGISDSMTILAIESERTVNGRKETITFKPSCH